MVQSAWAASRRAILQHRHRLPPSGSRPVQARPSEDRRNRWHISGCECLFAANKSIIGSFRIQVSVILTHRETAPPSHGCSQLLRPSMSPRRSAVELRLLQGELPHGLARPCRGLCWPLGTERNGLGMSHRRAQRILARSQPCYARFPIDQSHKMLSVVVAVLLHRNIAILVLFFLLLPRPFLPSVLCVICVGRCLASRGGWFRGQT